MHRRKCIYESLTGHTPASIIGDMETIDELLRIREQLEGKMRMCQSELAAINKAIELVRRERLKLACLRTTTVCAVQD